MEMSVREARAGFAAALAAAERGERVTITKNGKPVAELGPPAKRAGLDWERMKRVSADLGIATPDPPLGEQWRKRFDDPSWTEELFGPDYR